MLSPPRPRVLHVVPAAFGAGGIFGGGERYAFELARHLADVVPTTLLTFGPPAPPRTVGQLRILTAGPPWYVRGQRTNPLHPTLVRAVAAADVIHCHQQHVLASSLTAALCRLTGRRVFVSELGGGGWDVSAYVSTDRWFHGHLHISEYSRHIFGHADWPHARVILGGVDVEKFSPDPTVPREPTVLFVGRLVPHKGVNDLIAALPEGLSLELIGRPYHPAFHAELQRLAVGKPVRFRPSCDDAELVRAYRRALCVVLPSVYRPMFGGETRVPELLGQTLLEGMACGAAAICTDVASMPEVVADGITGFVVPPNDPAALRDKLAWLRDRPTEARRLGEAGRARVLAKFTWPAVVERCLEAYRS